MTGLTWGPGSGAVSRLLESFVADGQAALAELEGDTDKSLSERLNALKALEAHGDALTLIETQYNGGHGVCGRADVGAAPEPTPEPTPTPEPDGPFTAAKGEAVTITCGGDPCMEVTVIKSATASKYSGKYSSDRPASGRVFLAAQIRYVALSNDASYNQFDWNLYVDDNLVDGTAFVIYGPEPQLHSGDLGKGKKVTGWMVWEVPKTGRVVASYEPPGADGAIFEVRLR